MKMRNQLLIRNSFPAAMPLSAKRQYLQWKQEIAENEIHGINAHYVAAMKDSCHRLIAYYLNK